MAEKVIRNNQSLAPFFGERLSFIRGLDPLGLQNTSDATFSMLLPGLNNVTGRIRYYSFYCWLLDEYSKQNGSTNPKDQQQFIRRAEYIIALASSYFENEVSSIPGSLYANRQISNDPSAIHDLQSGTYQANGSTTDTYWKYPLGAFGQYYLGSLTDIGLVSRRDNEFGLYVRTSQQSNAFISGEVVAAAFDANIGIKPKEIFFNSLQNGKITEAQLISLLPDFNLTRIPSETQEQDLLLNLLLQKDYPVRIEEEPQKHRSTTIEYLLDYVNQRPEGFSDRSFVYHCYDSKGVFSGKADATTMGWYYYQFNEYWQYANTAILNGVLGYLQDSIGLKWVAIKPFLDAVTAGIVEEFKDENFVVGETDTLGRLLENLEADEQYFFEACTNTSLLERGSNGFLLFFSEYLNQLEEIPTLEEYSKARDLNKDGEGAHYFLNEFANKLQMPIGKYIFEYLYKNIIYRHQYVAFRKIRGGTQSTQKFIIEDHHIRYLGNFDPSYTGPRIGNLISYLKDLGMIPMPLVNSPVP